MCRLCLVINDSDADVALKAAMLVKRIQPLETDAIRALDILAKADPELSLAFQNAFTYCHALVEAANELVAQAYDTSPERAGVAVMEFAIGKQAQKVCEQAMRRVTEHPEGGL